MNKYLTSERNLGDPNRGRVTAGKDKIFLSACILRLDGMKWEGGAETDDCYPEAPSPQQLHYPPRCCYLAPASRCQGRGGTREGSLTR